MHFLVPETINSNEITKPSMKIAIMQPYFLPYLGYYSLIKNVDRWIFNDEVQMINKGWVQRNRILKQYGGWSYIRVPLVKYKHTEIIKNVKIRNDENWQCKILAQIKHYKRNAPYFFEVIHFLEEVFDHNFETITSQNAFLIEKTCEYIGLDFKYEILSEMNLEIGEVTESDEWSLKICQSLNHSHYINPIMGKQFYDTKKYDKAGIKINFLNWQCTPYNQFTESFVEGLSILDVMMFNTPEEILKMLDVYNLE
jgi:hypothetical protein